MSVNWRLALRLVGWLVVVGAVLLGLATGTVLWTIDRFNRIEAARQFDSSGMYSIVQSIQADGDSLTFDAELLELVRQSGGWLQRIDERGEVTHSFFAPPDVPARYGPGELTAYWLGSSPFPYQLFLWIQPKNGVIHTLIYGVKDTDNELMERLIRESRQEGSALILPEELVRELKSSGSWLQLVDKNGSELAFFNKPEGAMGSYNVEEMVLRAVYWDRYSTKLVTRYDAASGRTWALSSPLPGNEPGKQPWITPENRVLIQSIGALISAALLLFAAMAIWFGHRIGSPIVHVMNWVRLLGRGVYAEPTGAGGIARSRTRQGGRKRKYKVYEEVIRSMESLSDALRRNERYRTDAERLREEWVAGVSHDLKTPLSSIVGYAHMLEAEHYSWTPEEVRSFAKVILDKSSYLEGLVNDLTLTYRLRSGVAAPSMSAVEMNGFMDAALREAAAGHPGYEASIVRFKAAERPVYILAYAPWMQRIVDNLVANALTHNRKGILLEVAVKENGEEAIIEFADDGKGMDKETVERLFEQYYRGTDTDSRPEGTGLGMAVAKALTEAMGGTIGVASGIGRGTTIRLCWPRTDAEE
jgi:two-component system OmpR family sensor kinase